MLYSNNTPRYEDYRQKMGQLELMHSRILPILGILRNPHNCFLVGKNKMPPGELSNHRPMRKHSLHLRDVGDGLYGVLCGAPCDVLYGAPCGVLYDGPCGVLCDDLIVTFKS